MIIQWGPEVDCYNSSLKGKDYTFYESFTYCNDKFRLGEFALFKQCNGLAYPTVARLLCLFKTTDKCSSHKGIVQWYTWAANFKFKDDRQISFDKKNEVIQNEIGDALCEECIVNLSDIQQKCYVIFATLDDPVHLIKKYNYNTTNHFSCRYKIHCDQLVPILSKDNISELGNTYVSYTDLKTTDLALLELSPLIKMASLRTSPGSVAKQKRKSSDVSPIIVLNCEKFDDEHRVQIKSPSNPLKSLKLTPKFASNKVNLLGRNQSVKRVLNDSFEDSHILTGEIPILPYSIVCLNDDDSERIKMTFKLASKMVHDDTVAVERSTPPKKQDLQNELKVFPTKLDNNIMKSKSPIKIKNLQNVDNCVRFLPDSDTPSVVTPRSSRRNAEKHFSTLRRSRRTVERKCYVDFSLPDYSLPKKPNNSKNASVSIKSNRVDHSKEVCSKNDKIEGDFNECTPRPKRNVKRPKKYVDEDNETVATNKCQGVLDVSSGKLQLADDLKHTARINRSKRKIAKPTYYEGSDRESKESVKEQISSLEKVHRLRSSAIKDVTKLRSFVNTLDSTDSESDVSILSLRKTKVLRASRVTKVPEKLNIYTSDEEIRTPKKVAAKTPLRGTPSRRAKLIREGIITPSVQARGKTVTKESTPLSKARVQLHVSFVPKSLPCREKEFSDIMNFLKGKLLDGCGGCMYISGVPGTGKTATVTEVVRSLQEFAGKGDIVSFKYINVNGMQLSEPRQSYVEIIRQLTGKTVRWEQAQTMLENKFVKSQEISTPVILVIDELDILCTKRQDVVYNLLDWPTKANAQLIVITIANTMDLPERLLMGRVTSRLGLTRLTFQAYTFKQLQEIVTKRLLGVSAFNPDAIQLVARKVASVSGDARRALDICRRAVEIAELEGKDVLVSMDHVTQALNAMITQPKVQAIKSCSKLEKLILQAVVAEVERTGVEETNFSSVFAMLMSLATLDGFHKISSTLAMTALSKLGAYRLLLIDQKCSNIHQRIILNISSDDVYYALTKTDL